MKIAIIGGGPGGYTAAAAAANMGAEVVLFERRELGGTCLNRGCIPTKALLASAHLFDKIKKAETYGISVSTPTFNIEQVMERKNKIVSELRAGVEALMKQRKVQVITEHARIAEVGKIVTESGEWHYDNLIIATGSEPITFFNDPSLLTSDGAIELNRIPETILIIGGGVVGLELASFWSSAGAKVTVVEMMPTVLPFVDRSITSILTREFKKRKIALKTSLSVEKIEGGKVHFSDGKEATFDTIIQAVGRKINSDDIGLEKLAITPEKGRIPVNNRMETAVKGVYAIGDVAAGSPMLAHVATAQAIVAVENIMGKDAKFDSRVIPNCIYTSPEIASAGVTEEAAGGRAAEVQYRVLGRAHAEGEISGAIKLVVDGEDRICGIHIIGERATDIIHEGVAGISERVTLDKMADIVRAHPSFSEIYTEVIHKLKGNPIHG